MTTSIMEYFPMRVNIRFIAKSESNEEVKGMIAPPPTPAHIHCLSSIKDELKNLRNDNETTISVYPSRRCENVQESESKTFAHSETLLPEKNANNDIVLEKTIEAYRSFLPVELAKQRSDQFRTKQCTTVISPFSERRSFLAENKINSTCQPMALQTTGGFFKGKPPITPFTRLGCYRLKKHWAMTTIPKTLSSREKRCLTADAIHMAKPPHLKQRPASHIPQRNDMPTFDSVVQRPTPPLLNSSLNNRAKDVYKQLSSESFSNNSTFASATLKRKYKQQKLQVIKHSHREYNPSTFHLTSVETAQAKNEAATTFSRQKKIEELFQRKMKVTSVSPFSRNLKINSKVC